MLLCLGMAEERVLELDLKKLIICCSALFYTWNDNVTSPPPQEGGTVVNAFVEAVVAKESKIV